MNGNTFLRGIPLKNNSVRIKEPLCLIPTILVQVRSKRSPDGKHSVFNFRIVPIQKSLIQLKVTETIYTHYMDNVISLERNEEVYNMGLPQEMQMQINTTIERKLLWGYQLTYFSELEWQKYFKNTAFVGSK